MSGLWDSFKKGSKWLGQKVLPVLAAGGAGAAVAGGQYAAAAGLASAGSQIKGATADDPEAPAAVAMPDEDAISRAKRRSVAAQMARAGRASTILTGDSETLG